MAESTKKPLWRAREINPALRPFTQKLNPNSLFRAAGLSRLAGMSRAHVSLVRLPPGKQSFAKHAHMLEEEWIYILSGLRSAAKKLRWGPAISWVSPPPRRRMCCAIRSRKNAPI